MVTVYRLFLFLLHMGHVTAVFWNKSPPKSTKITTNNPEVTLGQTLAINCSLVKGPMARLYITRKGTEVPEHSVTQLTNTSIQYTKDNVTVGDGGRYFCQAEGVDVASIDDLYIQVNVPIKPMCWSNNWRDLVCSWCPETKHIGITWGFTYSYGQERYPCRVWLSPCACHICGINTTCTSNNRNMTDPRERYKPFVNYSITVTQRYQGKQGKKTFLAVDPQLVIKPGKVKNLRTTEVTSRHVTVMWEAPVNPNRSVYVEYVVTTQSTDWKDEHLVGENTSYTATGLRPYTKYDFTVTAKSRYLGNPEVIQCRTEEDVPEVAPTMYPGSFRITKHNDLLRTVRFYWKNIIPYKRNGELVNCTVIIQHGSGGGRADKKTSCSTETVQVSIARDRGYEVQLRAFTKVGPSPTATWLIEHDDRVPPFPLNVFGETIDNSTIKINWQKPDWPSTDPLSYTIYECHNPTDDATSCFNMSAKPVPTDQTWAIRKGMMTPQTRYTMSTEVNNVSSGMMLRWMCVFSHQNGPPKIQFRSEKRKDPPGLALSWEPLLETCDVRDPYGITRKIEIHWCQTDNCAATSNNSSIDATAVKFNISPVKTSTNYTVTMITVGREEIRNKTERIIMTWSTVKFQEEGSNLRILLVAVVVVSLTVVVAGLSIYLWKRLTAFCTLEVDPTPDLKDPIITDEYPTMQIDNQYNSSDTSASLRINRGSGSKEFSAVEEVQDGLINIVSIQSISALTAQETGQEEKEGSIATYVRTIDDRGSHSGESVDTGYVHAMVVDESIPEEVFNERLNVNPTFRSNDIQNNNNNNNINNNNNNNSERGNKDINDRIKNMEISCEPGARVVYYGKRHLHDATSSGSAGRIKLRITGPSNTETTSATSKPDLENIGSHSNLTAGSDRKDTAGNVQNDNGNGSVGEDVRSEDPLNESSYYESTGITYSDGINDDDDIDCGGGDSIDNDDGNDDAAHTDPLHESLCKYGDNCVTSDASIKESGSESDIKLLHDYEHDSEGADDETEAPLRQQKSRDHIETTSVAEDGFVSSVPCLKLPAGESDHKLLENAGVDEHYSSSDCYVQTAMCIQNQESFRLLSEPHEHEQVS